MTVRKIRSELSCLGCGLACGGFSFIKWSESQVKSSYPPKCDTCIRCPEIRLEPDCFFEIPYGFQLIMVGHIVGIVAPSEIGLLRFGIDPAACQPPGLVGGELYTYPAGNRAGNLAL